MYQIVHILQIKMVNFAIPIPVLSISPSDLSDLLLHSCRQEVLDIVRAQHITSIESLLWTPDILAFVHLPAFELDDLKGKVAFELNDGSWSVMSGYRTRVNRFINALRSHALLEENACSSIPQSANNIAFTLDLLVHFPILQSLVRFYSSIHRMSDSSDHSFLISMIDNITDNLPRSTNNYRYSDHVSSFAYSLFIIGGQNAYKFVRLNLPSLLPS